MAVVNRISEQAYRELALNDQDGLRELWDGLPREKPLMSMKHDDVASYLGAMLISQLDRRDCRVNVDGGKTRLSPRNFYIPDVMVIPTSSIQGPEHDPRAFNAHAEPLPLVVEVWSPSPGTYDLVVKLRGYRDRGDLEIWCIDRCGAVAVASLPGVTIELDALLDTSLASREVEAPRRSRQDGKAV